MGIHIYIYGLSYTAPTRGKYVQMSYCISHIYTSSPIDMSCVDELSPIIAPPTFMLIADHYDAALLAHPRGKMEK